MQAPGLVPAEELRPTRTILVEPLAVSRATYDAGLRVITLGWLRGIEPASVSQAKLLPYVTSFLALEEARHRGAHDAIFVEGTLVREAATANVFVVRDNGALATPPDGPGVLGGITRAHVLDLALTLGLSCSVSSLRLDDLTGAREVFLTSSVREIAPVVAIDGTAIGNGAPGTTTRLLHRAFRVRAGARGPCPWE
jgi:branched-subunit amino acid aminotransferase/4-amino-4-deoxychorismate lyase